MPNTKERSFNRRSRSAESLAQSSVIGFSQFGNLGALSRKTGTSAMLTPLPHRGRGWPTRSGGRVRVSVATTTLTLPRLRRRPLPLARAGEGFSSERLVVFGGESRGIAGRAVEGRLQRAGEIPPHAIMKRGFRIEAAATAQPFEPAQADRDMADLVLIDAPQ